MAEMLAAVSTMKETVTDTAGAAEFTPDREQAVLSRCREGDWSEFGTVVRRYQRLVWAAIDAVVFDQTAIPDLVQETFIRVFEKLHTYRSEASFASWLYRIARNIGLNHNRTRSRRPKSDSIEVKAELTGAHPEDHATMNPDKTYGEEVKGRALDDMLSRLDEKYRVAINLYYSSGQTYAQIAEALSLPVNTVRTRLKRGREQLLVMARKEGW